MYWYLHYIGGWFYRGLGGIQWDPENPEFKNFFLRPALVESVNWVNCSYQSSYGEIVSNWITENGKFDWNVTVPANSTATISIPGKEIKVEGEGISSFENVKMIQQDGESSVLQIEAGDYKISSKLL